MPFVNLDETHSSKFKVKQGHKKNQQPSQHYENVLFPSTETFAATLVWFSAETLL